MKQLELNTWQRTQLAACVPGRGTTSDFRKYMRILDIVELTQEERDEVGWVETLVVRDGKPAVNPQTGIPLINARWQEPDLTFELSFEDADFDVLMALVETRETWAIRGPEGKRTEALLDKLKEAGNE